MMNFHYVLILLSSVVIEIVTLTFDTSESFSRVDFSKYSAFSELPTTDNILCRGCGSDVSSANFIISKLSPSSHYVFNDTLFNKEEVLVQVISHDIIFQFPVIIFDQSTCQGFGEWQVEESWFPGYHWKPCICSDCGAFLGWEFESISHGNTYVPDRFFALIMTSLIGESFTDSLVKLPAN